MYQKPYAVDIIQVNPRMKMGRYEPTIRQVILTSELGIPATIFSFLEKVYTDGNFDEGPSVSVGDIIVVPEIIQEHFLNNHTYWRVNVSGFEAID